MLITLCYSVLTWMTSWKRSEIGVWLEEHLLKPDAPPSSLVFIRGEAAPSSKRISGLLEDSNQGQGQDLIDPRLQEERPSSASSFYYSANNATDSLYSRAWSSTESSRCSSAFSTPRHLPPTTPDHPKALLSMLLKQSPSFDSVANSALMSTLCYNHCAVVLRRLLWQAEGSCRALVISPRQIVELHDWTAFKQGQIGQSQNLGSGGQPLFRILLEAEPGQIRRTHQYTKFSSFGAVVAWRWGDEGDLGLILECSINHLIELMHIFRLGNIVLDGGWRIYRLTTISTEGTVGTLISASRPSLSSDNNFTLNLTPAELRRLSASSSYSTSSSTSPFLPNCGVYRPLAPPPIPIPSSGIFERVSNLGTQSSKHDITTIAESGEEDSSSSSGPGQNQGQGSSKQLLNWCDRSPRKRSITNLTLEKSSSSTPRRRSFCPGGILGGGVLSRGRSSSLVSLLFKQSSSGSMDEEIEEDSLVAAGSGIILTPTSRPLVFVPSSKSHESLSSLATIRGGGGLLSPTTPVGRAPIPSIGSRFMTTSPRRMGRGKPPNILILCNDSKKREEIGTVLKSLVAADRYVVYDIRWDQLAVGGWSEQTALLVLGGNYLEDKDLGAEGGGGISLILQFLGDGGRLLTWAWEGGPPFGPVLEAKEEDNNKSHVLEYGPQKKVSGPLSLSSTLWGHSFPKIVETTDSEGYSRPLTAAVWARIRASDGMGLGQPGVLQLDGGAEGGKAILSQIEFDKCLEEEGSLPLLSSLLTHLGIEVSPPKCPDYSVGYLLGDHKKVQDFLSSTPATLQQSCLCLEFTPRGEKGSPPSHLVLPIHVFECPTNFSTLAYYDNLETSELGRLVIYADTLTSTSHVLGGNGRLRHGLVVIAGRQTKGRGRGGNIWLSPLGCATFSVQLVISLSSALGRRLSLIQHVAALSVILAVPNHKEIKLCVKWPNDIYAGDQKIGGILVESRLEGNEAVINIGIGVNVSNSYPTLCLNSILFPDFKPAEEPETGAKGNVPLPPTKPKDKKGIWTTEKLVATTLTQMEGLLQSLEGKEGLEGFLQLYQDNWIHGSVDEEESSLVTVEVSPGIFTLCRISGIDEYGFLRVIDSNSGNIHSVRPDGNSFDIANRLIAIKD